MFIIKKRNYLKTSLLIILFMLFNLQLISVPQKKDIDFYKDHWKEVTKFEKKRLPNSSLKVIEMIFVKAKLENNSEQLIKSLIYKYNNFAQIKEDPTVKIIKNLRTEIEYFSNVDRTNNPLVTSMLHSILASTYFSYYKSNMYNILERTQLSKKEVKSGDIKVWTAKDFIEKSVYHFDKSLEKKQILQSSRIGKLKDIFTIGNSDRKVRPMIYDFLVHRAIDFYSSETASLTRAKDSFNINNPKYLSKMTDFLHIQIPSNEDDLSFEYKTLKLYQELLSYNVNDPRDYNPSIVINDLARLGYIFNKTSVNDKDDLYEDLLNKLIKKHHFMSEVSEVYFKLAEFYNNNKQNDEKDIEFVESNKVVKNKKKAVEICKMVIKKYPDTYGASSCENLLYSIDTKSISLTTSQVNPIDKPILGLLKFKNIDKAYFKIIKTDFLELNSIRNNRDKRYSFFREKQAVKEWNITVKNEGDYKEHSSEIAIPKLSSGVYIIFASTDKSFDRKKGVISTIKLSISNISFISNEKDNSEGIEFYLFDRNTGESLTDISVSIWEKEKRKGKRKQNLTNLVITEKDKFKTDRNGNILIPKKYLENKSIFVQFNDNDTGDSFFASKNTFRYNNRNFKKVKVTKKSYFFTDRAIYRPGQTVYFKAITLELDRNDNNNNKPVPNFKRKVEFYDVNYQKLSSTDLVSNDFGSVSGSFQIPTNTLNGNYVIKDSFGRINISVEEYKRPKFFADFKDLTEDYKLNDAIKVTGKADSYAGFSIDNAKVTYRVEREVYYPYFWCFRYYHYSYFNNSETKVLKTGETVTDEKGEFVIDFRAIPDKSANQKFQPSFLYKISADITDITGETKTISKNIRIGYTSLIISNDVKDMIDISEKSNLSFSIDSKNLDGEFITSNGSIKLYKLKNQDSHNILRKRIWDKPDRFLLNKDNFKQSFPHDVYDDENELVNMKKDKLCQEIDFDTAKNKNLKFDKNNFEGVGYYLVEMTAKDKSGKEVKDLKYITVINKSDDEIPYKTVNWFYIDESKIYQPSDEVEILLGSSLDDANLLLEVKYGSELIMKELISLDEDDQEVIKIPIKEKYRGGISVSMVAIGLDRFFSETKTIKIPWLNKKLKYSIEYFRDKLKPGEKEEWKIKISGYQDEKVLSELLLTMYDASLDYFKKHSLENNGFNYIFKTKRSYSNWSDEKYFDVARPRTDGRFNNYDYPKNNISRVFVKLINMSFLNLGNIISPMRTKGMKFRGSSAQDKMIVTTQNFAVEKKSGISEKVLSDQKNKTIEYKKPEPKIRKNFNETAFFYPNLTTDENGEVTVSFTVPESLTKWNILGFAHTKKLEHIFFNKELITQKQLMVIPNFPRFFREGDDLSLIVKVKNLSEINQEGFLKLELFNPETNEIITPDFGLKQVENNFKIDKKGSSNINLNLVIPKNYKLDIVGYRIIAKTSNFSDAEQNIIPILKNRKLVTKTIALPIRKGETKKFKLQDLIESKDSKTLQNHKLTLEFTANPIWFVIKALPYLLKTGSEGNNQSIFTKFYANSLTKSVIDNNPKIQDVFKLWQESDKLKKGKNRDKKILLSNLEKNSDLKSILLEETPWVMEAKSETERMKNISLLFDENKIGYELTNLIKKLQKNQRSSGAWSWYKGMRESRYITQNIVSGFAKLKNLDIKNNKNSYNITQIVKKAIRYLDNKIKEDYEYLIEKNYDLKTNHLGHTQIQYLYARSSFINEFEISNDNSTSFNYYKEQAKQYWTSYNSKNLQGMIALSLYRLNEISTAKDIVRSIKEHAIYSDEMGMYWKNSYGNQGYRWYNNSLTSHTLMIELFNEVAKEDNKSVEEMKIFLLKQKQTNSWSNSTNTAEACFALLLGNEKKLESSTKKGSNDGLKISLGKNISIDYSKLNKVEQGTGYFKKSWDTNDITPNMGDIIVENKNSSSNKSDISWGAVYWQYFEDLDKIKETKNKKKLPLNMTKNYYLQKTNDKGITVLEKIETGKTKINIGDRIIVRIELRVDRNIGFIHMKDMRASGFEIEDKLSGYKYQGGLGYYQSAKDASTNFFFDNLRKGTFVFEYPLRATHKGNFSTGVTTIQSSYAPEFSDISNGERIIIK